ncbi:hypothetical protein ACTFIR_000963 [Dictyostelium discoideum]
MPLKSTTNIDNQYLNDYIKDLKKWQIEIKNKDKEIKQSKLNNNNKNDNSMTDQQQQPLTTPSTSTSSSSSSSTSKADNIIDNTNESIKYKEKGNKLFGQQKYKESIEYYTLAIQLDSTNAVLYGNRAMAYLKMKNYQQCEIDSSRCLNLDPTYTKAYHRRGIARVELKRFEEAIQDFKHLLKSDPSNKDILIELNKATSLLKDQKEKEKQQKEIDDKLKKEKDEKEKEKERKEKEEKSKIIQEIKNVQPPPSPSTPTTPITSTTSKSSNDLVVEQQPQPQTQPQQPQQPKPLTLQERLNRMANLKAPIPKVAPKNSFEFEKVYLSFNNDLSQLYQYFKLIDPNQLPIVLGDALTPSLFSDIISILEKYYLLMSLNIQFSSKNEKSSLKNIINSLNDCNTIEKSKIDYLLNKYAI